MFGGILLVFSGIFAISWFGGIQMLVFWLALGFRGGGMGGGGFVLLCGRLMGCQNFGQICNRLVHAVYLILPGFHVGSRAL